MTCTPVRRVVTGPDGRSYRLDTYIVVELPGRDARSAAPASTPHVLSRSARPVKKITVVVRDGATTSKTYVRETSTFDAAT